MIQGRFMKYFLLAIPCVATLAVPLYNNIEPRLLGFPLFYWVQIALIPLTAAFIYAAYRSEQQ